MQLPLSGLAAAFGFRAHIFTVKLALNRRKLKKKKELAMSLGTKRRKGVRDCFQEWDLKGTDSSCGMENLACEVLK